jgi:hypothetical protein
MSFTYKDRSGARKNRHYTKKGPGRMPYRKSLKGEGGSQ